MPRTSRTVVPDLPHHVVQRGHNSQPIFATDKDCQAYIGGLQEFREAFGLKIYGWCLMSNHVHLILDPGPDASSLSRFMKRLAGRHTRRINRLLRRTGTAWEGRFKCSPIEFDSYLLACARYVDLNPVRAGVVDQPWAYAWSSYRAKAGLEPCDWLDLDPCYVALGETATARQARYREFVAQGCPEQEVSLIRNACRRNQLTGSERFSRDIEKIVGKRICQRGRGRPRSKK